MSSAFSALSAKRGANGTERSAHAGANPPDALASQEVVVGEQPARHPKRKRKRTDNGTERIELPITEPSPVDPPNRNDSQTSIADSELTENELGLLTSDAEDASDPETSTSFAVSNQQLSTFKASDKNVLKHTTKDWTIKLGWRDTLSVLGQYDLWVKKGAVSVYGAIIHASSELHRVYAPSTHSIPIIRPVRNPYDSRNTITEVCLRSCSSGLRVLKNLSPKFGRIWNAQRSTTENIIDGDNRSFKQICESKEDAYARSLVPLDIPASWQTCIRQCVINHSQAMERTIVICGPKNSGKSTFYRVLSNALWSCQSPPDSSPRVCLLDCDPGQPEFGPPGDVSLLKLNAFNLGPPFTHPLCGFDAGTTYQKSHHYGTSSPKDNPQHYLSCIFDLLKTHKAGKNAAAGDALIINSPGWIQGTGLDLLLQILPVSDATDVVFLTETGPDDVVEALTNAVKGTNATMHTISSQPHAKLGRIASDLRSMQTMSYLHLDPSGGKDLRWNTEPLSSTPPLLVPYAGPSQAILSVMIYGEVPDADLFPDILDGSMVAIVLLESDAAIADKNIARKRSLAADETMVDIAKQSIGEVSSEQRDEDSTPPHLRHSMIRRSASGIPYLDTSDYTTNPLSPSHSRCLGQALIRSIDTKKQCFHLITPIPSTQLQSVYAEKRKLVLVRGKLDIPSWAYKEDIEYEKAMQAQSQDTLDPADDVETAPPQDSVEQMVTQQPWLDIVPKGQRGAKARRVRRDLKFKPQAD